MKDWKKLALYGAVFAALFWLPVSRERFNWGVAEALHLGRWYAREHVLLCLVPAMFIAGAIGVFVSQASVMKYLGARANKVLAYGVASVSGSILAVCSCTVLPLFAGIWRMGAGLGPATAFLYSGPAINVLAIILTARVLGLELGIARAVGAVGFSVIIGLAMHFIYRKEESTRAEVQLSGPELETPRPLAHNALFFFVMIGVLVFANWGAPNEWLLQLSDGTGARVAIIKAPEEPVAAGAVYRVQYLEGPREGTEADLPAEQVAVRTPVSGIWATVWRGKWVVTAAFSAGLGAMLIVWFGVAWWKVLLAAILPAALALVVPGGGLWVLVPFAAAVIGLSVVLGTSGGEGREWLGATWGFARQILPLLFAGVLVAGFLLGRPDHEGLIPSRYVEMLVGDSPERMLGMAGWGGGPLEGPVRAVWPLWTNFFASVFGAFMYFATLTEVPIVQGLIGSGMGKGPALALLLAGPAVSLPSMLVIGSIMGVRKTVVFCSLVVVMATVSGMVFGALF